MDWNNDGRIDVHDYAHYKSVIDTDNGKSGVQKSSIYNSYSDTPTSIKVIIGLIILYVFLKLIGLD